MTTPTTPTTDPLPAEDMDLGLPAKPTEFVKQQQALQALADAARVLSPNFSKNRAARRKLRGIARLGLG